MGYRPGLVDYGPLSGPYVPLTFIKLVRTARMDQPVRSSMNLVTASAGNDAPDLTMSR